MINEETIKELNNLNKDCWLLFNRKKEFEDKLNKELGSKSVRLICCGGDHFSIYVEFADEKKDIKDIANVLGYDMSMHIFRKVDGYVYGLTLP